MLTPQEVSERTFQKSSFGGYQVAQVDEFLDQLTTDYTALYNENAILKSKMKVLVDKVEEYRATEEAMRKALMTAQRMADNMVKDAEQTREQMLQAAQQEVQQRKDALAQELRTEEFRLSQAQGATRTFVEKVRALQAQQEQLLSGINELCPAQPDIQKQAQVADTVGEIDENVQRLLEKAIIAASAQKLLSEQDYEQPQEDSIEDTAEFLPAGYQLLTDLDVNEDEDEPQAEAEQPADMDDETGAHTDFGALEFGKEYKIN